MTQFRMRQLWWLGLVAGLTAACSDESDPAGPSPDGGTPDLDPWASAGLEEWRCPAGEVPLDDGGCQPAGIPPDGCGEGFEHDGAQGCEVILPASECPEGEMAIPARFASLKLARYELQRSVSHFYARLEAQELPRIDN